MKEIGINLKEAEVIFRQLSRDYKVFERVSKTGKGRFSETDLITYDFVEGFEEIEFFEKSYYSAKEVLFPVRQTLFEFRKEGPEETQGIIPPTIVFLRACDINAISVTDTHFLKGNFEDSYYKEQRSRLKLFLIECSEPFESCFCVSMGTNRAEDYAVFMRKTDTGLEVKIKDSQMEKYFIGGVEAEVEPNFIDLDLEPISLQDEIDTAIFKDEMWQEYSRRCIACGRCNTSCPTCTCFTLQDIFDNEKGVGQRRRVWSSCQVKKFSLLAGSHDFRVPKGDRMRYRVLHKIQDFRKRTGLNMCVGCGRCDEACPEYISMFKCIQKINTLINAGTKDE